MSLSQLVYGHNLYMDFEICALILNDGHWLGIGGSHG